MGRADEATGVRAGGTARAWVLGLQGVTLVGVAAGVQGFLSGAFEPLVADLGDALAVVDGPVLPAAALVVVVGVPHATALVLVLRRSSRAPAAAAATGGLLAAWVLAQLPLIGWTSPVQWAFATVGLVECAAALRWRALAARDVARA
jgi:hypothetical protein